MKKNILFTLAVVCLLSLFSTIDSENVYGENQILNPVDPQEAVNPIPPEEKAESSSKNLPEASTVESTSETKPETLKQKTPAPVKKKKKKNPRTFITDDFFSANAIALLDDGRSDGAGGQDREEEDQLVQVVKLLSGVVLHGRKLEK
ncbi:hypothetical protein [Enterococcus malodoratus]|uniref:Uncharacterized protein n=1 Tax=Enterococcus malodoratus ATCC 43197 TaxID=1158601 RepID=R2NKL5_9ENTE|nr:hypothetical protein [Enterococcus malodoratus]EOH71523.1 hypothetical protein UAI_04477 [Enterococcus malodoratus ATCC 43197]EOT69787.1 hypothetical protein I585_01256 [Enterococcus malodoratus ATCC 43197]OJG63841.1 hypothetical protein RV07_GL000724 [Enterococcus malodoratus]SPX01425.1 Uncharacterised protein [Enterococcus malodoratus]STC70861.1 Uncharacterised protein [Enterococcus malodoratus]